MPGWLQRLFYISSWHQRLFGLSFEKRRPYLMEGLNLDQSPFVVLDEILGFWRNWRLSVVIDESVVFVKILGFVITADLNPHILLTSLASKTLNTKLANLVGSPCGKNCWYIFLNSYNTCKNTMLDLHLKVSLRIFCKDHKSDGHPITVSYCLPKVQTMWLGERNQR